MIKLQQLYKTYHSKSGPISALQNVSLNIEKGNITGVIGKSGAGKSTLIRCVNFLEKPDQGRVIIDGVELGLLTPAELREQRRKISMIFQHFNLLSSATVYDNIALPLKFAGVSKQIIKTKVERLLTLTDLTAKAHVYPAKLSGGQKQRVAIARALATEPKILLCDEATSALDPETTQTILALLKTINQELQLTILLITHEIDVVKNICDEVAVLDQGQIIEQNNVLKFFTQPKTAMGHSLISNSLKLDLPTAIANVLHVEKTDHGQIPVLRIRFIGESAGQPLLSHLVTRYDLQFNILQANIELIQQQTIGVMVFELYGDQEKIQQGVEYLRQQGLKVEVIGYASNV